MEVKQEGDVHSDAGFVEIKIKTLDAKIYNLRVDRNSPVPALKDQIASVVGVPVENQRLICRGKVLKDDQLLTAYSLEDGHTLHLVARQPPQHFPSSSAGQEQSQGDSGMGVVSPQNRSSNHVSCVLMGTINVSDPGGGMPDLNRIISAVLSSVGIGNTISGVAGTDTAGTEPVNLQPSGVGPAIGPGGQLPAATTDSRPPRGPVLDGIGDTIDEMEAQLQLEAIYGISNAGMIPGQGPLPHSFRRLQVPIVLSDALTTMSQYLDRLERAPPFSERSRSSTFEGRQDDIEGVPQPEENTSTRQMLRGGVGVVNLTASDSTSMPFNIATNSRRLDTTLPEGVTSPSRPMPRPSALGSIVRRVQELLDGHISPALSRLAAQLDREANVIDASTREEMQRAAVHDGHMVQHLGALLLELGRATLTLRLGQSPAESAVNAGPAVFISSAGPNPMIFQPRRPHSGVAVGASPAGLFHATGDLVGSAPRSVNIHIHAGEPRAPSSAPVAQQPAFRAVSGVTSGAPIVTVRQMVGHTDAAIPEHALTMQQILEHAGIAGRGQLGNIGPHADPHSGAAVPASSMTSSDYGRTHVVPAGPCIIAGSVGPLLANEGLTVPNPMERSANSQADGQPGEVVQGDGSAQITDSLGPFLNQLAVAFQQGRLQPPNQQYPDQPSEQAVSAPQKVDEGAVLDSSATTPALDAQRQNQISKKDEDCSCKGPDEKAEPGSDVPSQDQMGLADRDAAGAPQNDSGISSANSFGHVPLNGSDSCKDKTTEDQSPSEDGRAMSMGLGLGGLQPLPDRSRRRTPIQPHQRRTNRALAAASSGGSQRKAQEDGHSDLGDILSQSVSSRTGGDTVPGDTLRVAVGEIMQSPVMENVMRQLRSGAQNESTQGGDSMVTELDTVSQSARRRGLDLPGLVQQMLPVVSQMLSSGPTVNMDQQVPTSATRIPSDESAGRGSLAQGSNFGTWNEALSQEEENSWSETIDADLQRQESMEPQIPFSDIYMQGSPLPKRQRL